VTPSKAITARATLTLTLRCSYSAQPVAAVTFVGTSNGSINKAAAVLTYRAPLQCGVVDQCQFVMTGDANDLPHWTPPEWPNLNFGATTQPAWAHRAEKQSGDHPAADPRRMVTRKPSASRDHTTSSIVVDSRGTPLLSSTISSPLLSSGI
jgi:hypothetical protein